METSVKHNSTLQKEVDSVIKYLENEEIRYTGKFYWKCSMDPDVDENIVIPKMLIQTFVKNTLNHELFQNPEGGKVEVSVHKSDLGVLIMVTDNGSAMHDSPQLIKHRQEKLMFLDEYIRVFNDSHAHTISYHILERNIGEAGKSGSRVLITIEYQKTGINLN